MQLTHEGVAAQVQHSCNQVGIYVQFISRGCATNSIQLENAEKPSKMCVCGGEVKSKSKKPRPFAFRSFVWHQKSEWASTVGPCSGRGRVTTCVTHTHVRVAFAFASAKLFLFGKHD